MALNAKLVKSLALMSLMFGGVACSQQKELEDTSTKTDLSLSGGNAGRVENALIDGIYANATPLFCGNANVNLDYTNAIYRTSYTSMPTTQAGLITGEFLSRVRPYGTQSGSATTCGIANSCSGGCHKGLDQRAATGTHAHSPIEGVVTFVEPTFGQIGIYNAAYDVTFIFVHMSNRPVRVGQTVSLGQYIGQFGSVGASAPHSHTEIRAGRVTSSATAAAQPTNNYDPRIAVMLFPLVHMTGTNLGTLTPILRRGDRFTVNFTNRASYPINSVFRLELSNRNGVFDNTRTVIGTFTANSTILSGSIVGQIPATLISGTNYRFRLVLSTPTQAGRWTSRVSSTQIRVL